MDGFSPGIRKGTNLKRKNKLDYITKYLSKNLKMGRVDKEKERRLKEIERKLMEDEEMGENDCDKRRDEENRSGTNIPHRSVQINNGKWEHFAHFNKDAVQNTWGSATNGEEILNRPEKDWRSVAMYQSKPSTSKTSYEDDVNNYDISGEEDLNCQYESMGERTQPTQSGMYLPVYTKTHNEVSSYSNNCEDACSRGTYDTDDKEFQTTCVDNDDFHPHTRMKSMAYTSNDVEVQVCDYQHSNRGMKSATESYCITRPEQIVLPRKDLETKSFDYRNSYNPVNAEIFGDVNATPNNFPLHYDPRTEVYHNESYQKSYHNNRKCAPTKIPWYGVSSKTHNEISNYSSNCEDNSEQIQLFNSQQNKNEPIQLFTPDQNNKVIANCNELARKYNDCFYPEVENESYDDNANNTYNKQAANIFDNESEKTPYSCELESNSQPEIPQTIEEIQKFMSQTDQNDTVGHQNHNNIEDSHAKGIIHNLTFSSNSSDRLVIDFDRTNENYMEPIEKNRWHPKDSVVSPGQISSRGCDLRENNFTRSENNIPRCEEKTERDFEHCDNPKLLVVEQKDHNNETNRYSTDEKERNNLLRNDLRSQTNHPIDVQSNTDLMDSSQPDMVDTEQTLQSTIAPSHSGLSEEVHIETSNTLGIVKNMIPTLAEINSVNEGATRSYNGNVTFANVSASLENVVHNETDNSVAHRITTTNPINSMMLKTNVSKEENPVNQNELRPGPMKKTNYQQCSEHHLIHNLNSSSGNTIINVKEAVHVNFQEKIERSQNQPKAQELTDPIAEALETQVDTSANNEDSIHANTTDDNDIVRQDNEVNIETNVAFEQSTPVETHVQHIGVATETKASVPISKDENNNTNVLDEKHATNGVLPDNERKVQVVCDMQNPKVNEKLSDFVKDNIEIPTADIPTGNQSNDKLQMLGNMQDTINDYQSDFVKNRKYHNNDGTNGTSPLHDTITQTSAEILRQTKETVENIDTVHAANTSSGGDVNYLVNHCEDDLPDEMENKKSVNETDLATNMHREVDEDNNPNEKETKESEPNTVPVVEISKHSEMTDKNDTLLNDSNENQMEIHPTDRTLIVELTSCGNMNDNHKPMETSDISGTQMLNPYKDNLQEMEPSDGVLFNNEANPNEDHSNLVHSENNINGERVSPKEDNEISDAEGTSAALLDPNIMHVNISADNVSIDNKPTNINAESNQHKDFNDNQSICEQNTFKFATIEGENKLDDCSNTLDEGACNYNLIQKLTNQEESKLNDCSNTPVKRTGDSNLIQKMKWENKRKLKSMVLNQRSQMKQGCKNRNPLRATIERIRRGN